MENVVSYILGGALVLILASVFLPLIIFGVGAVITLGLMLLHLLPYLLLFAAIGYIASKVL